MKAKKKNNVGSVKIDPAIYEKVLKYCNERGIKIGFFVGRAAEEKLELEKVVK